MDFQIKVITLDNFYRSVRNPAARDLFSKMVLLRNSGYGPDYPENFLPVDAADYICTHHLFCVERSGQWVPIGGFRQISFDLCRNYSIQVPFLRTLMDSGTSQHQRVIQKIVDDHAARGSNLTYSAGLTIRKEDRQNKELAQLIKELYVALTYQDLVSGAADAYISYAVLRFKVHEWYPKIGYQFIEDEGVRLPPLEKKSAGNELVSAIYMSEATTWAEECYRKHASIFKDRIWVGPSWQEDEKIAA